MLSKYKMFPDNDYKHIQNIQSDPEIMGQAIYYYNEKVEHS